jgi:hypothetical protein
MIETIKKVTGKYFRGTIKDDKFEITHFCSQQPPVTFDNNPQSWRTRTTGEVTMPVGNFDSLKFIGAKQNFSNMSIEELDDMVQELLLVRAEMEK